MGLTLQFILMIGGFIFLIKGADLLIEGSSALAYKFSVSEIVIGLTIVAFGTSSPELIVNVVAAVNENSDIGFANIIGSNIINILLILGVAGLIRPLQTQKNTIWREIPFALLAALALFVLCNDEILNNSNNLLTRGDGLILLLFFIIFAVYSFAISKVDVCDHPQIKQLSGVNITLFIIIGLGGLILGGKLVVDAAVNLAQALQLSQKFIGLTIVAIGTSLPELFTSAMAAKKGNTDIAIGNVIGSNIFNILFILAVTAFIRPMNFKMVMNTDLIILILTSFLLFFTMFTGKRRSLDRWEAILFLILFAAYNIFLIIRN